MFLYILLELEYTLDARYSKIPSQQLIKGGIVMKNRTKCFLTVLITYLSMCLGSWLLVYFLITAGSEPVMAIIAGFIASLGLSTAGTLLRKQPKSVLLSYALTIGIA